MNLLQVFRDRVLGSRLPPPQFKISFTPYVPPTEPRPKRRHRNDRPVGRAFALRYQDLDGAESQRRITVHCARQGKAGVYLQGYCHEAKEPRSFRVAGIRSLIDRETGEILDQEHAIRARIDEMLAEDSASSATITAIARNRAALAVLLFLARCDGEHPSETDVILGFLDHFADGQVDESLARRKLEGLYPDPVAYDDAFTFLSKHPDRVRPVLKAARRLVDADGAISEQETIFAQHLDRLFVAG